MDYNKLLAEIKPDFIIGIKKIIDEEVSKSEPILSKKMNPEIIYTDIMALGYNFGDLKKAADDIYETQSQLYGANIELYKFIQQRVEQTKTYFPRLISVFSSFHKKTQAGEDFGIVLSFVRSELEK
jgi:hypothetical protein